MNLDEKVTVAQIAKVREKVSTGNDELEIDELQDEISEEIQSEVSEAVEEETTEN